MNLSEVGVRRPVFTSVAFIAILIFGFVSLANLSIELMPDITFPSLSIITTYSGTGPQEIETTVTKPIEDAVATIPNVKSISSTSIEDSSTVTIEFEWGTDLDSAANDVRDNLDFIKKFFPEGVENPILFKFSSSMMPVIFMGIRADESYPRLRRIVQDNIIDPLKQVDGVGNASLMGGLEREIRIELNQAKINGYKISINQITAAVSANNMTQPGGNIKIGKNEYIVRIPGEYSSVDQIRQVIVGNNRGVPIYLKDVANVVDSFKEDYMIVRQNDMPALMVMIQKQSGANTVSVSKKIKSKMDTLIKNLPSDVKIFTIFDSAEFISDSVNNLKDTILLGAIFVILVIVAFLIDWRPSLIICITIPISLIVAFIVMKLLGYTINIMSLSSLSIAIGMVVDDAIVVIENIYRWHYEEKVELRKASSEGAKEVNLAVTASTLTTIAIFVPVLFITGIVGIMFTQLAVSIIIVLLASLLCAVWLSPMMASILLKFKLGAKWMAKAEEKSLQITVNLRNFYRKYLSMALNHKTKVIYFTIIITGVSLFLFPFMGKEFFPQSDEGSIQMSVELESGRRVEETDSIMKKIESILKEYVPEAIITGVRFGKSPMGSGFGQEYDSNIGHFVVRLVKKHERKRSTEEISHILTEKIEKIPGIKRLAIEQGGFSSFGGTSKPISIEVYGNETDTLVDFSKKLQNVLQSIKGTQNVTMSWKEGKQEIRININKEKAQKLGLSLYQIADTIKSSFAGKIISRYKEKGEEYNIFIRFDKLDRESLDNVKNIMIQTPAGSLASVASLADFSIEKGPRVITRKNKERYLLVESEIFGNVQSKIADEFNKRMKDVVVPYGISYKMGGSVQQRDESFGQLLQLFLLGILLVYLIMAAQFESFKDSFTIMFSVPFAIIGVFWVVFITGITFNVMTFVGMIMLIGVVVKNGIILVDYTNRLKREQGMELTEAILLASSRRLRPIIMTALTTIFGLLPMALATGEGSEMWKPLGIAAVGGLFVSTLVTLFIVPIVYYMLEKKIAEAGFWRRVSSFIIDNILVALAFIILIKLSGLDILKQVKPSMYSLLAFITYYGIYVLYSAAMESSRFQASIGKLLLGLKVTDCQKNKISYSQALKRNSFKLVSGLALFLGFIAAGLSENKRGWHDRFAGAVVIKK